MKPASASHDLVVVECSGNFNPKLRDTLQRKGFTVLTYPNYADLLSVVFELVDPILIVDWGNTQDTSAFSASLLQNAPLYRFPVLVLSKEIEGIQSALQEKFVLVMTLQQPAAATGLMEAINYISKAYPKEGDEEPKEKKSGSVAGEKSSSTKKADKREGATSKTSAPATQPDATQEVKEASHALYAQYESIPSLLFQQLQEFRLLEADLGGSLYPKKVHAFQEQDTSLLPREAALAELVQVVCSENGKWVSHHLHRLAYVAHQLLKPMNLDAENAEAARSAAFLFAISVGRKNKALLRKEFHGRGSLLLRKELCSLIKDSAFQMSSALQRPKEAAIIATLAKQIGKEEVPNDESNSLIASAIMAADLTDRICFQSGNWNPRAAHSLLRAVKMGKLRDFHPAILCCLAKFLAEAITSHSPAYLLPKNVRENPELIKKSKETHEQIIAFDESKIALDKLAPGMKLSQPLYAFDGRQLLDEDLTLDQDLIWRIWQLSALRPINAPVIIVRPKKETAGAESDNADEDAESSPELESTPS